MKRSPPIDCADLTLFAYRWATCKRTLIRQLAGLAVGVLSCDVAADTRVTGYIKSFAVVQSSISNPVLELPTTYQSQNSARLMLERFGKKGVWQLHYELSPILQSESPTGDLATFNRVENSYRWSDLQTSLTDDETEKNQLYQNLDRLNYQHQFTQGDLTIGRQAISFGAARIINPTDVFLPFDVRTLNQEYRNGVDAIRFQAPWGELREVDVGVVLGKGARAKTSAAFLQVRGNIDGKDLDFALITFAKQTLIGVGMQTALGGFGFWVEAAGVIGDEDYLRLSTGLDYAITEHIFTMVEYHHNGAGSDDPADYAGQLTTTPYQRGGIFLLGKNYLIPSISARLSPLWSAKAQGVINLDDSSAFLTITTEYNVAENLYIDFGYYRFLGDDLGQTADGAAMFQSEYGANPDTVFLSLRFYF